MSPLGHNELNWLSYWDVCMVIIPNAKEVTLKDMGKIN